MADEPLTPRQAAHAVEDADRHLRTDLLALLPAHEAVLRGGAWLDAAMQQAETRAEAAPILARAVREVEALVEEGSGTISADDLRLILDG